MKILRLAAALLLASTLLAPELLAQTPAPAKAAATPEATGPLIADVHPSPYRGAMWLNTNVGQKRFDMRGATLLDLITMAYEKRDTIVFGGPTWIEYDRFDVTARIDALQLQRATAGPFAPPDPYISIRPVLQRILAERFRLKYHNEDKMLPGYIVTVSKDAKFTEAKNADAHSDCHEEEDKATPGQFTLTCTSETIPEFLKMLDGAYTHPVVDHTGLTKPSDFTLKLNFSNIHSRDQYIAIITEILTKQLGLIVTLGQVSQPAMVIDSADRTPTPNQPDLVKQIPAPPDLEFEVASIRPAADDAPQRRQHTTGSEMTMESYAVQELLVQAFNFPTGAMISNRPPWFNSKRFTLQLKLPPDIDARSVWQSPDQFNGMLLKLLVDRFQIKYHWADQIFPDAWVLVPGTPKMKPADPKSRSFCKYGVPEGEKDLTSAPDSPFDRSFHCQNVTMSQFADALQSVSANEVRNHVPDKTGVAGSYDFTVFFTSLGKLRAQTTAAADAAKQAGGDAASAPISGMSLQDAIHKDLGIRLERQSLSYSAVVLDHIEDTPTEN